MGLLDDLGRNDLAGAAPGGETVEHDELVFLGDGFVELGLPIQTGKCSLVSAALLRWYSGRKHTWRDCERPLYPLWRESV